MRLRREAVIEQEPHLIQRQNGGWLASSERDSAVRLTTEGATQAEAIERFHEALALFWRCYERYWSRQDKREAMMGWPR